MDPTAPRARSSYEQARRPTLPRDWQADYVGSVRPEILYHYASPSGFAGVIEHSSLWATDVRFLNDFQELHYAWDQFQKVLADRAASVSTYTEAYRSELEVIENVGATDLDEMEFRVFATCLSELPDDVPQWRSYASDGRGVALGFDSEQIVMLKVPIGSPLEDGGLDPLVPANSDERATWGAVLGQVTYGADARQAAIADVLWQIEQHCGTDDMSTTDQRAYNLIHQIPLQLSRLAHVKHDGFKSEQEWRLTIAEHLMSSNPSTIAALKHVMPHVQWNAMPRTTIDVKFREGGPALFKPYTNLPFMKSALVAVVLGPNVNADLATPVIRRLLDRHGFNHTSINGSSMPYRT